MKKRKRKELEKEGKEAKEARLLKEEVDTLKFDDELETEEDNKQTEA